MEYDNSIAMEYRKSDKLIKNEFSYWSLREFLLHYFNYIRR